MTTETATWKASAQKTHLNSTSYEIKNNYYSNYLCALAWMQEHTGCFCPSSADGLELMECLYGRYLGFDHNECRRYDGGERLERCWL